MPGIFICYRRSDAAGYAGRLASDLKARLPGHTIFQDIESIYPGIDFHEAVSNALEETDVLLAIIGPNWLDATDRKGRRRLELPDDLVALEIEAGLKRAIRTIPVLVGDAEMPDSDQLPDSLKPLARRNAHEISDKRWTFDVDQLVKAIQVAGTQVVPRSARASSGATPSTEDARSNARAELRPGGERIGFRTAAVAALSVLLVVAVAWVIYSLGRPPGQPAEVATATAQRPPPVAQPVDQPQPPAVIARAPAVVPPPSRLTVKIGHVAPLTGPIAHLGKDNENGARLAVEQANAADVQIAGAPATFVLAAQDDQADPKVGTTVAQKLVDAKVAGVVGHLNSGSSIPASATYNQAGVPVISGSSTNPKLTEQGFKTQFRVVGRDDQQGPAIASYLVATAKPKTAAVIDDATAYGAGIADEVEKTLKAAGVKVLAREKGTDKTTDWKAVLTKLKGRHPDAVFYGGMDATGGPLLKQGRELGIKAVFAFGGGACTDQMPKLAGEAAAEGLLCSQVGIPAQAASRKFLDAYKARFNQDPILYSPFTYDATNLLIEAMKKANSADPAKYLPELQKINYNGATGPIAFDEKGDRKNAEMTIFTMKSGRIEPVAVIRGGTITTYDDFIALRPG